MTETEIAEWAKKLIHRFDNVKIVGSQGEWSGDARQGFMFNPRPIPTETIGACCFSDGTCLVETDGQCLLDGGIFQGGGTVCEPNPCTTGACCFDDGSCVVESQELCNAGGGTYLGDFTDCVPNPCETPPTGACCVGTDCTIETESHCLDIGGVYQGDETLCEPNPCGSGCECGPGFLFAPFHNLDDGLYYAQVEANACDFTTTWSDPVPSTARFSVWTGVTNGCAEGYAGSSTCIQQISPLTCDPEQVSCSGSVTDPDGNCYVGCDVDTCDNVCQLAGAPPFTIVTSTLSGRCI